MRIGFLFAWYDLWVGFFWDQKKHILYFFPIPCFGITFDFRRVEKQCMACFKKVRVHPGDTACPECRHEALCREEDE